VTSGIKFAKRGPKKGYKQSEEHKRKRGIYGPKSPEHRAKIIAAVMPRITSQEHREKMRASLWKGGITPERQALQMSEEWKKIHTKIWQRDKATCQKCERARKMNMPTYHIHHIESFENKELRLEPSNLVLLCKPCHQWVHSLANTEMEFIR